MMGVTCKLYIDIAETDPKVPAVGDYMVTVTRKGYGSAYLIVGVREARRVSRKRRGRRFNLVCQREPDVLAIVPLATRFLHWYKRS